MRVPQTLGVGLCLIAFTVASACSQGETTPKEAVRPAPAEFQGGEAKFKANCAACHGPGGMGTSQGPPLVHKINGVTPEDVDQIVKYVRWLQQQAGIF